MKQKSKVDPLDKIFRPDEHSLQMDDQSYMLDEIKLELQRVNKNLAIIGQSLVNHWAKPEPKPARTTAKKEK